MNKPQYLFDASEKPDLPLFDVPLVVATEDTVKGYGAMVDHPDDLQIEIVRWPAQGWRPVDEDTGDEGGWVEGTFAAHWQGDVLFGQNDAVGGHYVLGWSVPPQTAQLKPDVPTDVETTNQSRSQVLLWHMNYHPDGGQLFMPLEHKPFIVPVALPGDDLAPEHIVALWFDGSKGLYIHPNIWHEGVFPATDHQNFLDRQGRVHARVSCDLGEEFGHYFACPLMPGI